MVGVMTHTLAVLGFFRTLFQSVYFLPDVDWLLKRIDEVYSAFHAVRCAAPIRVCVCWLYDSSSATHSLCIGIWCVLWESPVGIRLETAGTDADFWSFLA